jgi:4-hydroxyacetophenone monooxygenase
MRNPHSGAPFTAAEFSDEQIAHALKDVSVPTLLLSCVHMTGDPAVRESILTGPIKPQGLFLNEVQGFMSEEDQEAARALALGVITDWRDRGCPEP